MAENQGISRQQQYLGSLNQLVEDMIVPLSRTLEGDAGLLQQVVLDDTALDHPTVVEAYLHELAKTTGIVISHCFCIA